MTTIETIAILVIFVQVLASWKLTLYLEDIFKRSRDTKLCATVNDAWNVAIQIYSSCLISFIALLLLALYKMFYGG